MQSLQAEVDAAGKAMRLKATCCYLAQPPVTLRPYFSFEDSVDETAGIYFPTGLDNSGRPKFQQFLSFEPYILPEDVPQHTDTLAYNRSQGEWCVSTSSDDFCSTPTDIVHPLDLGEQELGASWRVMQITDFATVFQGTGAGATTTARPSPVEPLPQTKPAVLPPQPPTFRRRWNCFCFVFFLYRFEAMTC